MPSLPSLPLLPPQLSEETHLYQNDYIQGQGLAKYPAGQINQIHLFLYEQAKSAFYIF